MRALHSIATIRSVQNLSTSRYNPCLNWRTPSTTMAHHKTSSQWCRCILCFSSSGHSWACYHDADPEVAAEINMVGDSGENLQVLRPKPNPAGRACLCSTVFCNLLIKGKTAGKQRKATFWSLTLLYIFTNAISKSSGYPTPALIHVVTVCATLPAKDS